MKIGLDLTRLDDTTIQAMRTRLRTRGIVTQIVARENERFLVLEAETETDGFEQMAAIKSLYAMNHRVVVWHEELGEFIDVGRFQALREREQEQRTGDGWEDEVREERDPLGGVHGRADY